MVRVFLLFIILINVRLCNAQTDSSFHHDINLGFGVSGKSHAIAFMPSFDVSHGAFTVGIGPVINILPSFYNRLLENPRFTGVQALGRLFPNRTKKILLFFESNFIYQHFRDSHLGYTNIQNSYELYAGYGFMIKQHNWSFYQNAGAGVNRSSRLYDNSFGLQTREYFYNFGLLAKIGISFSL